MSAAAEMVLAFVDLIKANIDQYKGSLLELSIAAGLVMSASFLLTGGVALVMAGVFMALMEVAPAYVAALVTGALLLATSGSLLWMAQRKVSP